MVGSLLTLAGRGTWHVPAVADGRAAPTSSYYTQRPPQVVAGRPYFVLTSRSHGLNHP